MSYIFTTGPQLMSIEPGDEVTVRVGRLIPTFDPTRMQPGPKMLDIQAGDHAQLRMFLRMTEEEARKLLADLQESLA